MKKKVEIVTIEEHENFTHIYKLLEMSKGAYICHERNVITMAQLLKRTGNSELHIASDSNYATAVSFMARKGLDAVIMKKINMM